MQTKTQTVDQRVTRMRAAMREAEGTNNAVAIMRKHARSLALPASVDRDELAAEALAWLAGKTRTATTTTAGTILRRLGDADPVVRATATKQARMVMRRLASNAHRAKTIAVPAGTVATAIAADGRSENPDRDSNGTRLLTAERFAAAVVEDKPRHVMSDAGSAKRQKAVHVPRFSEATYGDHAWNGKGQTRLLREQSLETMLSRGFRLSSKHTSESSEPRDVNGTTMARRERIAAMLAVPAVADHRSATQTAVMAALNGRPFGAWLADHVCATESDARGVIEVTEEENVIRWTEALESVGLRGTPNAIHALRGLAERWARDAHALVPFGETRDGARARMRTVFYGPAH
jgi:hypothetical protein